MRTVKDLDLTSDSTIFILSRIDTYTSTYAGVFDIESEQQGIYYSSYWTDVGGN